MTKPKKDVRNVLTLIRVSKEEKKLAIKMAKDSKYGLAKFFRQLIIDANEKKYVNMHMKIVEKEKEVLEELKELLGAVKAATSR
jgi:hypothetical protein